VIDRFAKIVDKEKKMVVRNAPSIMHPDWRRRVSVKRRTERISEKTAGHRNVFRPNHPLL
jgi:hypothetical protein